MAKVLIIASCGFAAVALILATVAVAFNTWMTSSHGNISIGLWISCVNGVCVDITYNRIAEVEPFRTVRTMVIVGIVLLPVSIFCAGLKLLVVKNKDVLLLIGGVIAAAAGLFLMVAMALFHEKIYKAFSPAVDLAYGFALDVTAWILAWVAAALMIASKFVDF